MSWDGYYINLDRAVSRRVAVEGQLSRRGLQHLYKRFPAVDGRLEKRACPLSGAEAGIFRSHLELIARAAGSSRLIHVIEDDVIISRHLKPFIQSLSQTGDPGFDMLVTDTGFSLDTARFEKFRRRMPATLGTDTLDIQMLDITRVYLWGMTSYILTPSGARKFKRLAEEEWSRGPGLPIDRLLQKAARSGQMSILCALPFLTWLDMDSARRSLADRRQDHLVTTLQQLARYPLYAEQDQDEAQASMLKDILVATCGPSAANPQLKPLIESFAGFLLGQHEAKMAASRQGRVTEC